MDIIDVILAKSLTPQGQIETYAAKARAAVTNANTAVAAAQEAVTTVNEINEAAQDNVTQTQATLTQVQQALTEVEEALEQIEEVDKDAITTEIRKLAISSDPAVAASATNFSMTLRYAQEVLSNATNYLTLYAVTGTSKTGGMTQDAITKALNDLKVQLEKEIEESGGGGGGTTPSFDPEDEGKIVVVGDEGAITPGQITEESIIEAEIAAGTFVPVNAFGIEVDYKNKTFARKYNSIGQVDYDASVPFGGRKRCLVDNTGRIVAFYGDANYNDTMASGYQTMVYQPKFYYVRMPLDYDTSGNVIKEVFAVSSVPQKGLKIHPAFLTDDGKELEYVLLGAYEGCAYDPTTATYDTADASTTNFNTAYLSSVANVKPITGASKSFTADAAERMAKNRGIGWHIMTLEMESINQMLCTLEFNTFNGQEAIERGISDLPAYNNINGASLTGSTSSLGNATGHADSTINEHGGTVETYTVNGKRAISYRGFENPWGNTWRMIGNARVYGDGSLKGGAPIVCSTFNYDTDTFEAMSFTLPNLSSWIGQFGYDPDYDWAFIPTGGSVTGNAAVPVGDYDFLTSNLNDTHIVAFGGNYSSGDNNGPFYIASDYSTNQYSNRYSARLIHVPTPGAIHDANYNLWKTKWEG